MNLCLTYCIMCTHWLLFVLLTLTFGLPTGRTPQGIAIMVTCFMMCICVMMHVVTNAVLD